MKKRVDIDMQHRKKKKSLKFLTALSVATSNIQQKTMCFLSNPTSLEILQQYSPLFAWTMSEGISLTCELHSAVILIPLPWSCHHANQNVSVASAYFSPVLCFLCLRRFGMQKSQRRSPSSASLSIQLLSSS